MSNYFENELPNFEDEFSKIDEAFQHFREKVFTHLDGKTNEEVKQILRQQNIRNLYAINYIITPIHGSQIAVSAIHELIDSKIKK